MKAMTAVLLKQVLVSLLRRSLTSLDVWAERFSVLGDFQIAMAFVEMVSRPTAHHSVESLARNAGLSRSAFMKRFTVAFGRSPISVLRLLRLRHAAVLLAANSLPIDHVAKHAGYTSRGSFTRAFRAAYGLDPTAYRDMRCSN